MLGTLLCQHVIVKADVNQHMHNKMPLLFGASIKYFNKTNLD